MRLAASREYWSTHPARAWAGRIPAAWVMPRAIEAANLTASLAIPVYARLLALIRFQDELLSGGAKALWSLIRVVPGASFHHLAMSLSATFVMSRHRLS